MSFVETIREVAKKRILFLPHALTQMNKPDRLITPNEVKKVVFSGEIIEDYPEDPRGHSCLLLAFGEGDRALHVVCAPKKEYLAIITAYLPSRADWSEDYKLRR